MSPNFEDEQGFGPKISQESAYINFNFKKFNREKEKRKPLSFMMCYRMILLKQQKENPAVKVRNGVGEERPRQRDETHRNPQPRFRIPFLPYFKAPKTPYFLHYNTAKTEACLSSSGLF